MKARKYGYVALLFIAPTVGPLGCRRAGPPALTLNQRLHASLNGWNVTEAVELVKQGADPDTRSSGGNTTLMYAGNIQGTRYVKEVLARGADVNVRSLDGWTALLQACNAGNDRAAAILIAHGAKVNVADSTGM